MPEEFRKRAFRFSNIYEVFFQGKGIEDRELSYWRIIFGVLVMLAGAIFWSAAMVAILAKAIAEVVKNPQGSE